MPTDTPRATMVVATLPAIMGVATHLPITVAGMHLLIMVVGITVDTPRFTLAIAIAGLFDPLMPIMEAPAIMVGGITEGIATGNL